MLCNYFMLKISPNKDVASAVVIISGSWFKFSCCNLLSVVRGLNPLVATYRNKDDFCF